MDFTKLDTRTAQNAGHPLTLRYPDSGEDIISDGKPCLVFVKGSQSRDVQTAIMTDSRKKLAKGKDKASGESLEEIQRELIKGAARFITGFENIERDGDPLPVEDAGWLLDLNFVSTESLLAEEDNTEWLGDSFAQQILKFANDADNFLVNPAKP